ncbi:MAG: tetratricopeptide repeat protein, partial [Chloroflexota bacterium]|nr:tetratricopeptide repeat protein [Chloroflexota bacterium]
SSRQVALLLARYFGIPDDEHEAFVAFARSTTSGDGISQVETRGTGVASDEILLRAPWRAARLHKTNLPHLLTRLIGRDSEIAEAGRLLVQARVRLLTLTGAPGIGKTRLALQVGSHLLDYFEDGVFLVELAAVDDPDLVSTRLARVLGLKESAGHTAEETLFAYMYKRRMLLILDNFEHLLDAAPLVVRLLESSLWLKVLATSREVLHVRGERRFPVPTLAVPAKDEGIAVPCTSSRLALGTLPSVELFVERAQEVASDFVLNENNAADVAAICIGLEGLPLAIELTAARIDQLSSREMRDALDRQLDLGKGGARDLPPRQRTLLASIEWSYNLLHAVEQAVFRTLGAFVGGFTPAAVSAVCEPENSDVYAMRAIDMLLSLVNKNLVRLQNRGAPGNGDDEDRYGLLEAIREFAYYKLALSGEEDAVRLLHARYFTALAEEVTANRSGPRQATLLARMDADYSNVIAALNWLLSSDQNDTESAELAVRLASTLYYYWDLRGYFTEGREWQARALEKGHSFLWLRAAPDGTSAEVSPHLVKLQTQLMNGAGLLAWNQGDHEAARRFFNECLSLFHSTGNKKGMSSVLNNIAILEAEQGRHAQAIELYVQVLDIEREIGALAYIPITKNNIGVAHWARGEVDKARALYEESLALYRQIDDPSGMVLALDNLGIVATHTGDYAAARRYQEEALLICHTLGHKNSLVHVLANMASRAIAEGDFASAWEYYGEVLPLLQQQNYLQVVTKCLEGLAALNSGEGHAREAAYLWGAAEAMRQSGNHPMTVTGVEQYEHNVASARAHMDAADFQAAWAEGGAMSVQEALTYALNQL